MVFGELKKGQKFYTRHTEGVNKYISIGVYDYDRSNAINLDTGNRSRFGQQAQVTLIPEEGITISTRVPTAKLVRPFHRNRREYDVPGGHSRRAVADLCQSGSSASPQDGGHSSLPGEASRTPRHAERGLPAHAPRGCYRP